MPQAQPATTFNPIRYIPRDHKPAILSHPINQIQTLAHPPSASNPTTNHWSLLLRTTSNTTTPLIHLDCQPTDKVPSTVLSNGSKARLVITELPLAATPPTAVRVHSLRVRDQCRVENVVDTILAHGQFRYEFDEKGEGGRAWVRDQLDLFVKERVVVDRKGVEEVKKDILKLWPGGTMLEIDQGAYYRI